MINELAASKIGLRKQAADLTQQANELRSQAKQIKKEARFSDEDKRMIISALKHANLPTANFLKYQSVDTAVLKAFDIEKDHRYIGDELADLTAQYEQAQRAYTKALKDVCIAKAKLLLALAGRGDYHLIKISIAKLRKLAHRI